MKQRMSLRQMVGQLFAFPAFGPELDEETRRLVAELNIGGVFLGTHCLRTPEQVHRLTSGLQRASLEEGSGIPLFVSADFVAGAGCKLSSGGAVYFPKNRAIGASGDESLAYLSGKATAEESLAMGVNFNYSPVVDINNNPRNPVIGTHSFGDDAETVSRLGGAVIRGYQEHGMIATAKHFPGHGDTSVDSHEDLPVLPFDRERLERFELAPFRHAIEIGVDAIMVGHIAVPAFDPTGAPASLSFEMNTKLLRENLGFEGLIVTDGLSMKGITNKYTMEEACILAVLAGADILLATADDARHAAAMFDAVVVAAEQGRIPLSRIEESVERAMRVKRKYRLTADTFAPPAFDPAAFRKPEAEEVDRELARKALTPLAGIREGLLSPGDPAANEWLLVRDAGAAAFAEALKERVPGLTERVAPDYAKALDLLEREAGGRKVVAAISHNKPIAREWLGRYDAALGKAKQAVWVHFGSEYDALGTERPCLLMYDRAPSLQRAAAAYLTGR